MEAYRARLGKRSRLLVIVGVLAAIVGAAAVMGQVQSKWSRDAERKAVAVEGELRSAVQGYAAAVEAGTATFSELDPVTQELRATAGSFAINRSTGQLTANRTVSSGAADRCVTVRYDRTTRAVTSEVKGGLCPPLVN